jgi:OOP family OmpA-OmpF porin
VEAGIKAVTAIGQGTITFSDADISLVAAEGTAQAVFDRAVGELKAALPQAFSLNATLPKAASAAPAGPAEFTASLSTEGRVELRGRLTDDVSVRRLTALPNSNSGSARFTTPPALTRNFRMDGRCAFWLASKPWANLPKAHCLCARIPSKSLA